MPDTHHASCDLIDLLDISAFLAENPAFQQHDGLTPFIMSGRGRIRLDAIGWQIMAASREQLVALLKGGNGAFVLRGSSDFLESIANAQFMPSHQLARASLEQLKSDTVPKDTTFDPEQIAARQQLLNKIAEEISSSRTQLGGALSA